MVLTEDNFSEIFKPQQNHLDDNAGWDGTCYETFGQELEYVLSFANDFNKQKRVWTLLDVDGIFYIAAGYQVVNRFGYFITEKPWETGSEEIECEDLTTKIEAHLIVGMKHLVTKKRQGAFGYYDEEMDTNDNSIIQACIEEQKDYRYFDKYGNEFCIEEILTK